jgi:hypothetical protein
MCNELTAHTAAVNNFLAADPDKMVQKSGAVYSDDGNSIIISYYAQKHFVSIANGQVTTADNRQVSYNDATLILQYLKQCSGLPPRNRWLSFLELPQGIHHHVPFIKSACEPIRDAFGSNPGLFLQQTEKLGGKPIDMGDAAALIPAFPKLPLAAILWEGDDEFPARATILFDSIAPYQLTTAALWVLGCELAKKLVSQPLPTTS